MLLCCVKINGSIWFLFSPFVTSFLFDKLCQTRDFQGDLFYLECLNLTFSLTHPITTPRRMSLSL